MKNKNFGRKTTAVLCALAISAGQIPALAASASDFSDMPNNWAKPALEFAIANGLIQGYNGLLRPNDKMTRAEMATVLNQAFAATAEAAISFTDVPTSAWYYTQVAKAIQMQTFVGMNDTQFGPNTPITREQAFSAIARAFRLEDETTAGLNSFSDKNEVSGWAAKELSALVKGGYIVGDNGKLRPQDTITRAEFCQIMYQLIAQFVSESGEVSQLQNGNILVNHAGVTVKNANVTGDLVAGDGIMAGTFTVRDTTVGKRLLIRGGATNTVYIYNTEMKDGIAVFNPNNTVLIVTDSTPKVKNNLDAQTSVILQGTFGTVTVAKDAIVTVKAGSKVDNWVFEDGATMKKNVIFEQSGGSSGGGGGGGVTPTPATKYAWKLKVDSLIFNGRPIQGASDFTRSKEYDASKISLRDFMNQLATENKKTIEFAAVRMLKQMESPIQGKLLIEDSTTGKLGSITMQSTANFDSTNLLSKDKQDNIVTRVNAVLPADSQVDRDDVVAALGNVVKTTDAQQTDADKTMNQLNNQASNAKTEAEKAAAKAAIEAEKKSAEGQQKILEEIEGQHSDFFVNGTNTVIEKCKKKISIPGIEITPDNAKDLEKTYREQYSNMQRVLADQISKLDALLAQFNTTTPRGNVAVMAANTKSVNDKLTMKVPVSINIGKFALENQPKAWNQMDNLFAQNDPYYEAFKQAVDLTNFITSDSTGYYLKASANQSGAYSGNDFNGDCAAYLTQQALKLEPLMYDVAASAKLDPSNTTYDEDWFKDRLIQYVDKMNVSAEMSKENGNDNNTTGVTPDYAAFIDAFRANGGTMTVEDAQKKLGADKFVIQKKFFGGSDVMRRMVDRMLSAFDSTSASGRITTDQVMNFLDNYTVEVNATLDLNTSVDNSNTGNQ